MKIFYNLITHLLLSNNLCLTDFYMCSKTESNTATDSCRVSSLSLLILESG